jgi:SH3-like domain-containing protein
VKEAEEKLDDADRLIGAENFGSASFFSSRAARIARNILEEAKMAESVPGVRTISGRRVNLRDGPSTQHAVLTVLLLGMPVFPEREEGDWILLRTADGSVGWVHRSLIR